MILAVVVYPIVHVVEKLKVDSSNPHVGKSLWEIFFTFIGGGGILNNRPYKKEK